MEVHVWCTLQLMSWVVTLPDLRGMLCWSAALLYQRFLCELTQHAGTCSKPWMLTCVGAQV